MINSKVFFLKDFSRLGQVTQDLLAGRYAKEAEVVVKMHFGEPGNDLAFKPEDVKPVVEGLHSLGCQPLLLDSPVAYFSPRGTVVGYELVVKLKGFNKLAKCHISNDSIPVPTKDYTAEVIKELAEAKNVLVLTHVKGHGGTGFGGAIKNLGMGGVTKETKILEHALCKPDVAATCVGCGTCSTVCPAGAIKIVNGKAEINKKACWGCSVCEYVCPTQSLVPPKATLDDLLAQAAVAVISQMPINTFYISILKNIARDCDCSGNSGGRVLEDIGVLFSDNPVAIDKASLDLINEKAGKDLFKELTHKDPMLHVNFTAEYLSRSSNYELVFV
ncbi:MAG: DUF362 domain-containing protein [bacterium]|nr:DUF362 domain-containing protein [bacterium]